MYRNQRNPEKAAEIDGRDHFRVESGALHITDPCYDEDTWCAIHDVSAKNGEWYGVAYLDGQKVRAIVVEHQDTSTYENDRRFQPLDGTVGVDSGQAGVFDAEAYGNGEGDYGDLSTFYGRACYATLPDGNDTEVHDTFGYIKEGFVSRSGYGDGSYTAYGIRDGDELVAVKIVFIQDDIEYDW